MNPDNLETSLIGYTSLPTYYETSASEWIRVIFGREHYDKDHGGVWVMDEAAVEFSRERRDVFEDKELQRLRGLAVGLGNIGYAGLEIIDWSLYISDAVGINGCWRGLVEKSNEMLLSQDIYGRDIYVCNHLWHMMFDDLERKRNSGYTIDGLSRFATDIRIANALSHLYWCELFGGYYNEKQFVGQEVRNEILRIDSDILMEAVDRKAPTYVLRSEYLENNGGL